MKITLNPPQAILGGHVADLDTLNQALASVGNYSLHVKALPIAPKESLLKTFYPLPLSCGALSLCFAFWADTKNLYEWMLLFISGFFILLMLYAFWRIRMAFWILFELLEWWQD